MNVDIDETVRVFQEQARLRGLQSGALQGGLIWPVGTLCRWAGPKSKTVFVIIGSRPHGEQWAVCLHPIGGSHLRQDLWTGITYLRREETAVFEDRDEPGAWRGWCSCGYTTPLRRGVLGERNAAKILAAHDHDTESA